MITASYAGDSTHVAGSGMFSETVTANLADISVAIHGATKANGGVPFAETLTISNAGPATATKVLSAMYVPEGLTVTNAGGGQRFGSTVYWTDASLASGAKVTHTVTFTADDNADDRVLIPAGASSLQVKDPNYRNNAAAIAVELG